MRKPSRRSVKSALIGALIVVTIVFAFDLMHYMTSSVDDGWLSPRWYLFAAMVGLILGGPIGSRHRKQREEAMIRQTDSRAIA